jgi:hypothetical protein
MLVEVVKPRVLNADPDEINARRHVLTARVPQYKSPKALIAPTQYTTIRKRI